MEPRPSRPDLGELLQHGDWLRELVVPLLGADAADDAVQETWAAALEKPPRVGTRWRAWLARVAWNRAQRARRAAHRRVRREALAAKSERVPAADRLVAELELQAQLVRAVLALEPDLRRAILLRYYEELPPRTIAAELGVPVEKVKAWLHRGLAKLRASLGGELGTDWRASLAPLALAPPVVSLSSISAPNAAFAFGVLMQAKLVLGVLALAGLGLVGWFAWPDGEPEPWPAPVEIARSATPHVVTQNAEASTSREIAVRNPDAREAQPTAAKATPNAEPRLARISGRCVDEHGAPLSGVNATLHGSESMPHRTEAYLRAGGKIDWSDPEPLVTGDDGRFAFEFDPPPPYRFLLALKRADRVDTFGSWNAWERAQRSELGDVRLVRGCAVSGRVVDAQGVPQGSIDLSFDLRVESAVSESSVAVHRFPNARSAADGTFRVRGLMAAGIWDWKAQGRKRTTEEPLVIAEERPDAFFDLVLEESFQGGAISGVVVDESGQPIRGASVGLDLFSSDRQRTDHEGRFRIAQPSREWATPVRLHVSAPGFEGRQLEEGTAWNTENVRITLQRALEFDIAVHAAATREPIEEFGIRIVPQHGARVFGGSNTARRGTHAGGVLRVKGERRGKHWLLVDPSGPGWSRSPFFEIEIREGMPRVEVALHAPIRVTVRIEDPEHRARENSLVSIVDAYGKEPLRHDSRVENVDSWNLGNPDIALLLAEGRTNAQGEVALLAPPDRDLSIFVRGESHLTAMFVGVQLEADQTLVYTVTSGARLAGKLEPAPLVAQLWSATGLDPQKPVEQNERWSAPRVELRRTVGDRREQHPHFKDAPLVTGDGRFDIACIPPGSWELHVHVSKLVPSARKDSTTQRHGYSVQIGSVRDLADGESREVAFNRPDLVLAELSGTVLLDGAPFTERELQIAGIRSRESGPEQVVHEYTATDAAGRFAIFLDAGSYQVQARLEMPKLSTCFDLPANEHVTLTPGQRLERNFHVESGEAKLRLLDAAGAPAAGVHIYLRCEAFEHEIAFPATDTEGRTLGRMPAGSWRLSVFKPGETVLKPGEQRTRVEIGQVRIAPGQMAETEHELRLPASWTSR
ncbi:MAG: sigma-70 family RNA polymerase sigma factor [Planctomycetes bacterium]|nr:sigma-70 family RNA polymerase sigma factor [Planctomycetota bacterium]